MYDMVIGRELLDQVSGFVVPVMQRFVYFPHLTKRDLTSTHFLPVVTGRAAPTHSSVVEVTALADALAFMPACGAFVQGEPRSAVNPVSSNSASACNGSQASLGSSSTPACGGGAASDGSSSNGGVTNSNAEELVGSPQRVRRRGGKPPPASGKEGVPAWEPQLRPKAWGVLAHLLCVTWPLFLILWPFHKLATRTKHGSTLLRALAVPLWPVLWLARKTGGCVGLAWAALVAVAAPPVAWRCVQYRRRRREHWAKDGSAIRLAYAPGYRGRPPKKVNIYSQPTAWPAGKTISARLVLLVLLLLAAMMSTVAAVKVQCSLASPVVQTRWALAEPMHLPLPYTTCDLLVAGLNEFVSGTFRRSRWFPTSK
jgi:hypothetical protein